MQYNSWNPTPTQAYILIFFYTKVSIPYKNQKPNE